MHDSAFGLTYAPAQSPLTVSEHDDTTGWLARRTAVTRLLDLPSLHDAEPRDVRREARITWGGGMIWSTAPLVRVVERTSEVRGEVLVYWFNLRGAVAGAPVNGEIGASTCGRISRDSTWNACRPVTPLPVDWRLVADSLTALGLWSLPGEGVQFREPPNHGPTDQTSVEIELREGRRYRAYYYYAPDLIATADGAQVDTIVNYLRRVLRAVR